LEPLLIFGGRSVADKLVEAGNSGWSWWFGLCL
jgi:hypothetical protein